MGELFLVLIAIILITVLCIWLLTGGLIIAITMLFKSIIWWYHMLGRAFPTRKKKKIKDLEKPTKIKMPKVKPVPPESIGRLDSKVVNVT